ncbi:class F sortase [Catelliglobosispora koreensis]|uniref:class F sortase n=1 Tax=Catelliglobosispora koreensis TaxID=129052 RepID=UPI0009FD2A66|nr:class F sortase [Catelliglobosispora koreensis]
MADRSGHGAGPDRGRLLPRDQAPSINRVVRHRRAGVKGWVTALIASAALIAAPFVVPASRAIFQDAPPPPESVVEFSQVLTGPPSRLRIPAIGVDAQLVRLKLDRSGKLEAPEDFHTPGWYADGTAPGDSGPAVIAGHLDSLDGKAVFYRLHELKPADVIEIERDGQWLSFHVTAAHRYAKSRFPTAEVYGPTPDAQLRLITCGGGFDKERRSYYDNVVVFAVAA